MNIYPILEKISDKQLIEVWEEIDKKEPSKQIFIVRGLLMDEIEKRWPVEFEKWIDNTDPKKDLKYFINNA